MIEQVEDVVNLTIKTLSFHEDFFREERQKEIASRAYFDPTVGGIAEGLISSLVILQRIIIIREMWESFDSVTFHDVLNVVSFLATEKRWTEIMKP